jgi:hypothetical protein
MLVISSDSIFFFTSLYSVGVNFHFFSDQLYVPCSIVVRFIECIGMVIQSFDDLFGEN